MLMIIGSTFVLSIKLLLLAAGPSEGFEACYRPVDAPRPGCERSYENPFFRQQSTRIDEHINFGAEKGAPLGLSGSDWDLTFVNSSRFNYLDEGQIARERLPFQVEWEGQIRPDETLTFDYVGEIELDFGDESATLPAEYTGLATEAVPVPAGANNIRITYLFTPPDDKPDAPYAMVRLTDQSGDLVKVVGPALPWRVAAGAADLTLALFLLSVAYLYGRMLAKSWHLVASAALFAVFNLFVFPSPWFTVIALAIVYLFALLERNATAASAFMLSVYLASLFFALALHLPSYEIDAVFYRSVGEDQLTYESQARAILQTGSLQGGEDVFVYSPGFRYVLFSLHFLLGDADTPIFIFATALLIFAVFFLVHRLWPRLEPTSKSQRRKGTRRKAAAPESALIAKLRPLAEQWTLGPGATVTLIAGPLSMLLLLASPYGVAMVSNYLTAEFPTWILLIFGATYLWCAENRWQWFLGVILVGAALIIRMEQTPGLILLIAVSALRFIGTGNSSRLSPERIRVVIASLIALGVIVLLPAMHNLYFGRELALLPRTPQLPVNFPLPLSDLPQLFSDQDVRDVFLTQIAGVLGFDSARETVPGSAIDVDVPAQLLLHSLQAVWLLAIAVAVTARRLLRVRTASVLLVPIAFLVPHIFIQVYVAYPRHIVAGYLAFGFTAAFVGASVLRETAVGQRK